MVFYIRDCKKIFPEKVEQIGEVWKPLVFKTVKVLLNLLCGIAHVVLSGRILAGHSNSYQKYCFLERAT